MLETKIQYSDKDLKAVYDQLKHIPSGFPSAISRAANKTLTHVRSVIVKEAYARINSTRGGSRGGKKLTQKAIRSRVKIKRATRKDLSANLTLSGKGISLAYYNVKNKNNGIEYVSANKKYVFLESAFIPVLKSGYLGVFKRKGKSRLPIQEFYGDSIAELWNEAPSFAKDTLADASNNFRKNVDTQVALVIDKFKKKKGK